MEYIDNARNFLIGAIWAGIIARISYIYLTSLPEVDDLRAVHKRAFHACVFAIIATSIVSLTSLIINYFGGV